MIRRLALCRRLARELWLYVRAERAWALLGVYGLLALAALFVPMERRWVQRPIVYAIF